MWFPNSNKHIKQCSLETRTANKEKKKWDVCICILTHLVWPSNATIRLVNPDETMRLFTPLNHGWIKLTKRIGHIALSVVIELPRKTLLRGILMF